MDWSSGYEIRKNVGALVSGFKGYFTPENLDYESTDALKRHDVYRDRFLLWVLG